MVGKGSRAKMNLRRITANIIVFPALLFWVCLYVFDTGLCCVAQAGLELTILLP
jgi:hypothetical protein